MIPGSRLLARLPRKHESLDPPPGSTSPNHTVAVVSGVIGAAAEVTAMDVATPAVVALGGKLAMGVGRLSSSTITVVFLFLRSHTAARTTTHSLLRASLVNGGGRPSAGALQKWSATTERWMVYGML
jgi:predicted amino acid dehydrogenase